MVRHFQVTFDAADPHGLCRWWADLLGYEVEDKHDMIVGLIEAGAVPEAITIEVDGRRRFADLIGASDPEGTGPRLLFQRVPEPKSAKNRVHLDVPVGDPAGLDAARDDAVAKGATFVDFHEYPGLRWAVMRDPEGNEFCLT